MAIGEIIGEILFEIIALIIFHILFEIAIQILMGVFGLSRTEAEGSAFGFLIVVLFSMIALTAYRRKRLGKAVVLDTDGDGIISAEEEAVAFGIDEGEWWEEE